MAKTTDPFTIIVDSREQSPWEFGLHNTAKRKLDAGDYSIEGLEDILAIERKKSVSEIAINLNESRFADALDRLSKVPYCFILLEFSLDEVYQFPIGSDIPKSKWDSLRVKGKYIVKRLLEIELDYKIPIWFCDYPENAEKVAVSIMKRVYEQHNNTK